MKSWKTFALLMIGAAALQNASAAHKSVFALQSTPVRVKASILAVSSSSRQSFAGGQDIYLAEIQEKKHDPRFVRLIDNYPGYGLPIRDAVLESRAQLSMRVMRDPGCDLPSYEVFLPRESARIYDGSVRDRLQLHRTETVECYRTVHDSIRFAK